MWRKDGTVHFRKLMVIVASSLFLLAACGKASQEDVVKKIEDKWADTKGYEVTASMELAAGGQARAYDVKVWHMKPEFYRVEVAAKEDKVTQMIIRNEEGVFVVTPSLSKTYKFQNDWPKQNSQAYLIESLAQDIKEDKKATMTVEEDAYIFNVATRNAERTGLTKQSVTIDKKSLLPKNVALFNEAGEQLMTINFHDVKLNVAHKKEDYAVEKFQNNKEKEAASADVKSTTPLQTYYPMLKWDHTKLVDTKTMQEDGLERVILTFEGEKAFTFMQQPVEETSSLVPVAMTGDIADLGFTIGAITDYSISWEHDGMAFFIASNKMTKEEMIEVAASVTSGGLK